MKKISYQVFAILLIGTILQSIISVVSCALGNEASSVPKDTLVQITDTAELGKASTIHLLYNDIITLQQQSLQQDNKLKQLQAKNKKIYSVIRGKTRQWHVDKINKLKDTVSQTRQRYEPLFASYRLLNKQLSQIASKKKDERKEMLRQRRDTVKVAVRLARLDIKSKVAAVRIAKENRSRAIKRIRSILVGTNPIKEQIKTERRSLSEWSKRVQPLWRSYNQAIKHGDAESALQSLTTLLSLIRQMDHAKKKLEQFETRIIEIGNKAEAAFS